MERSKTRLANDAWESLLTTHTTLMKRFAAEDIWQEVTMREYDVLYTLAKCRGPIRLSDLNRNVLLSQPALSRMVDRLVARGLLTRTTDPSDKRGVRLALTAEGRAAQRRVGGRHGVSVSQAMTARLTKQEQLQLEYLCRKLASSPGNSETSPRSELDNEPHTNEVAAG